MYGAVKVNTADFLFKRELIDFVGLDIQQVRHCNSNHNKLVF